MVISRHGNLLEAKVDAVVNTVNTVGVMGKGIALMFKERYRGNFTAYAAACKSGAIQIGHMFVTDTDEPTGPRWIINFPTKQHWRHPSRLEWIAAGLEDLVRVILEKQIRSLALPRLGCGNGGLGWQEVRPLIEAIAPKLPGVEIIVYEPIPISDRRQVKSE
jgi:O-acetyl-ADP-ribose deacetylase (regulator of RNase III)